jgi:predicted chitinase
MDKNKILEEFARNLLEKGKESGMVWNGVKWVPAEGKDKTSSKSKSPKRVSTDSYKTSREPISKDASKNLIKSINSIASEMATIKKSLLTFVKSQEKMKKRAFEDKLKEKNEAYAAKYKKTVEKKPEKISEEPKKSFFEFIRDLFKNILKFFAIGIGLIALNKFLNIGDVKETIKNLIVKIIETISNLIVKGADLIHDILKPGETSNKLIEFIEKIINSVIQVVSDFVDFIKNFVQKVATDDKLLGNIKSIIENIVITLFTVIKAAVETLKTTLTSLGPELTEGLIKGITFVLNGIAEGVKFLTSLVNDPEFRQSFAEVFQAVYDFIASIFDIEVPIPVFGSVKIGTIIATVIGTMALLEAAMYGVIGYLAVGGLKAGMRSGSGIGTTSDKSGKTGKTGKGGKFANALSGSLGVVQLAGLGIGATTAAYAFAENRERGEELRERYSASGEAPTGGVPTTRSPTSTSASVPSTPTPTSASAPVPPPPPMTQSASMSAASDTAKNKVIASGTNMQLIEAALKRRGLTSETYIRSVLANVMKESGGKPIAENLNYGGTPNDRIRKIFGQRAAVYTDGQLDQIKRSPQMMGELMYGHQTTVGQKLGNTQPGDGFLYRGRGFIQLTGKGNYAAASQAIYGDDRLVKNPDLLLDPTIAAETTAWYMQKGRARMAQILGMGTENLSQEQSDLLATSQIAGSDIRKKGAVGQEIMSKVASYSGGNKALYAGSEAGRVQTFAPTPSMPSLAGVGGATEQGPQGPDLSSPFGLLSSIVGSASKSAGDTFKNLSDPENFPTMTAGGMDMGKFLDTASEDLKKMLQDNELIGAFFKDQTNKASDAQRKDVVATNTSSMTNPEVNSGIGSIYDEEFIKKVFA